MRRAPAELRPVIRLLVIDERVDALTRLCERLGRHRALHVHGLRETDEAGAALATGNFDAVLLAGEAPDWPGVNRDTIPVIRLQRPGPGEATLGAPACASVEWTPTMDGHDLGERICEAYQRWRTARRQDTLARWVEREARFDHVTGLHNRRVFDERLEQISTGTGDVAFVLADVAGLNAINQAYGFATGDEVLRFVGTSIARSVRGEDMAARIGGDEFGILLADAGLDVARMVARRIAHELEHEMSDGVPDVSLVFSLAAGSQAGAGKLFTAALARLDERRPQKRVLALVGRARDGAPGPGVA